MATKPARPDPSATPAGTPRPADPDAPPAATPAGGAEDDDGAFEPEPERGPLRRCLVTRERMPKESMIRFVLGPDRALVPDLDARLPGRGMWLSARADVIERATTRGAFARAARGVVHLPPDLRALIEDGLRRRVRDLIGFARRAGQAVSGWQAVREWLQANRVGLLVEARDGSPAERARLVGRRDLPVVMPLAAAELGAVFGRDHVVHAAVAPGRLAEAIGAEAARLAGVAAEEAESGSARGPGRTRTDVGAAPAIARPRHPGE